MEKIKNQFPLKALLVIGNKADKLSETEILNLTAQIPTILLLSAKEKQGIDDLKDKLISFINLIVIIFLTVQTFHGLKVSTINFC